MNPLYEPILVFPKFDPLTAPGLALCFDLVKTSVANGKNLQSEKFKLFWLDTFG